MASNDKYTNYYKAILLNLNKLKLKHKQKMILLKQSRSLDEHSASHKNETASEHVSEIPNSSSNVTMSSKSRPIKKKKKVLSEEEKKLKEIKQLLSKSDKFYQENRKVNQNDPLVKKALRVLMNPLSTSSHNGSSLVYVSWSEYCKQNQIYLSSLGHEIESGGIIGLGIGNMPDIIMPGVDADSIDDHMLDKMTCKIKGNDYVTKSGLKRMNQNPKAYPSILEDFSKYEKMAHADSSDEEYQTANSRRKMQQMSNEDENGESMDEEYNEMEEIAGAQYSIVKPKLKNKRLKCQRCKKGGHEDVTCIEKKYVENIYCHICHTNGDHDSLECPKQNIKCAKCEFIGHDVTNCRLGNIQMNLLH